MDDAEITPLSQPEHAPAGQPDLVELQAQLSSLHNLVVSILALLIVVSGTLWVYLMRQVKYTRLELDAARPQVTNIVAQYQKNSGPAMDEFVRKLTEYGRAHADFAPILAKYGVKPTNTTSVTGPVPAATHALPPALPKK
jgi:hypothetical protein